MKTSINPTSDCAQIYTVDTRNALQMAAAVSDIKMIDRITDDLARDGLVRKRSDDSKFQSTAEKGAA